MNPDFKKERGNQSMLTSHIVSTSHTVTAHTHTDTLQEHKLSFLLILHAHVLHKNSIFCLYISTSSVDCNTRTQTFSSCRRENKAEQVKTGDAYRLKPEAQQ